MDKGVSTFVEKLGLLFEAQGTSRSMGRIAGLLLVSDRPMTLDEIAEALDLSKASVSTNTRFLETVAMIERVSVRGDRKVYYQAVEDFWVTVLRASTGKIKAFVNLAQEGQRLIDEDNRTAQRRLKKMEKAYGMLYNETIAWANKLQQELKDLE